MKISPDGLSKRYYTIGEISTMFDVNSSLLRYWETVFVELQPAKTKGGKRKYTKEDVMIIKDIFHLVKTKGYTLEGAKEGLNRLNSLRKVKTDLEKLRDEMTLFLNEIKAEKQAQL